MGALPVVVVCSFQEPHDSWSDAVECVCVCAGFDEVDARQIITTMAKPEYKDFFIDHMMKEELEKPMLDETFSPLLSGLAMLTAFLGFGSLPLWPYLCYLAATHESAMTQFWTACAMTAVALFLLGLLRVSASQFTASSHCWFSPVYSKAQTCGW